MEMVRLALSILLLTALSGCSTLRAHHLAKLNKPLVSLGLSQSCLKELCSASGLENSLSGAYRLEISQAEHPSKTETSPKISTDIQLEVTDGQVVVVVFNDFGTRGMLISVTDQGRETLSSELTPLYSPPLDAKELLAVIKLLLSSPPYVATEGCRLPPTEQVTLRRIDG